MAAGLGNYQKAYIHSTVTLHPAGGSAYDVNRYTWLGCETSNSVNRTQEAVECSDKSTGWAKFLSAKRAGTFEVTAYADNTDQQQVNMLKGLHNGAKVEFFVGQVEDDQDLNGNQLPVEGEYGECIVTAISDTNDFGAVSSRQITLQATGELTHYPDLEEEEEE